MAIPKEVLEIIQKTVEDGQMQGPWAEALIEVGKEPFTPEEEQDYQTRKAKALEFFKGRGMTGEDPTVYFNADAVARVQVLEKRIKPQPLGKVK